MNEFVGQPFLCLVWVVIKFVADQREKRTDRREMVVSYFAVGFFVVLSLLVSSCMADQQCACTMPSGNTYDLARFGPDPVVARDSLSVPYIYYHYMPCGVLTPDLCGALSFWSAMCEQIEFVGFPLYLILT